MIKKLTEAGYIGAFCCLDNNQEPPATVVLWAILWAVGAIAGLVVMLYVIFANDYYEDKAYYKGTVPHFVWSGMLFSLSVYFCLGAVSVFKWTFVFLTLSWVIKTWLNLKKVYTYFNRHSQSYVVGETIVDFKTIKNLYQVSPYRLKLLKYYQNNFNWDNCLYKLDPKTNQIGTHIMQLMLPNFFEFLKFYVWDYMENRDYAKHKERKQRAKDIESNKRNLEMVIAQAQVDIDMLKERANAEIEQANEMMVGVKENMKKANKA